MTKIEKWAHLAEIVSALAVVVSLIYVGYEIRRNTSAVRDDTHHAMLSLGHDWDSWLADREFAETVVQASGDYSTLSPSQKVQYDQYVADGLNLWEAVFYSHRRGLTEDELWTAWDASFSTRFDDQGWRSVWKAIHRSYGIEFQNHVARYLSDDGAAIP